MIVVKPARSKKAWLCLAVDICQHKVNRNADCKQESSVHHVRCLSTSRTILSMLQQCSDSFVLSSLQIILYLFFSSISESESVPIFPSIIHYALKHSKICQGLRAGRDDSKLDISCVICNAVA